MTTPNTDRPAPKATRQAFGETLARMGEKHPEVVVLDADLSKSTKSEMFAKKYPSRFFEMGISEANMIGAAAGMAIAGKTPFACSFGAFITGRYDQIRLSVAYGQVPVRLIGTHAGVGIGDDGHSQMGLEDVTLMRALPEMGVFQPMDAQETEHLIEWLADLKNWPKPAYIRLTRQNLPALMPKGHAWNPFKIYSVHGTDAATSVASPRRKVVCFASGGVVGESVLAAQKVAASQVQMSVWNVCSLKPFDHETVLKVVANLDPKHDLVLSVEDHSVIGGLGSAVAEVLAGLSQHARLVRLGVQDLFGESGEGPELFEKHGISAAAIARTVLG